MRPTRRNPTHLAAALAAGLALAACGESTPSAPRDTAPPAESGPGSGREGLPVVRHDFGILRHGDSAVVDLEVPVDTSRAWVPVLFTGDCSCIRGQLRIRAADGSERLTDGRVISEYAVREGDTLIVRLTLDTSRREPVDMKPAESRAAIQLQDLASLDIRRTSVGVIFTWGVDSPIEVLPTPTLDFGVLAVSQAAQLPLRLRPSWPDPVALREASCTDPRIRCQLRPDPESDDTLLGVTFASDGVTLGPFRGEIAVTTDLEDYVLRITVGGEVKPDLSYFPTPISMGQMDFGKPADDSSFVMIEDRDPSRTPDLRVVAVLDQDGADASAHFVPELVVTDDPRRWQLHLRYAGGYQKTEFRGVVRVQSGSDDNTSTLDVPALAFHKP